MQSHSQCFESLTNGCNRIFPNQLSRPEVSKLKEFLTDIRFQYWPVSSIAYHALRNQTLCISLNTWYKYVNKFGLNRSKPKSRRKNSEVSIRADKANQIWHADITEFKTPDNVKHFIYLVVDNFSRKILSWKIADKIKSVYRKETIQEALDAINTNSTIVLITDGGSENKFLYPENVNHQIALVDVHYSNSLIESHNKLIKYNYLYKMEITNRKQLEDALQFVVTDYNDRPHVSLLGRTPSEAYEDLQLDLTRIKTDLINSRQNRKLYNQHHHCDQCRTK